VRTVAWFSAGAASTCATYLALQDDPDTVVAYIDPGSEHEDTPRYIAEVEAWLGVPILRLRSDKYTDVDDVIERTRYIVGPYGARCTTELKKAVRLAFQLPDDRQVFGFDASPREVKRAREFRQTNPEVDLRTPLIEHGWSKADCHAFIQRSGVKRHAMYELGYRNANCVGCVKAGMGYWNKIRVDFPEVFAKRSRQERELGVAINREEKRINGKRESFPVFLDELDPTRGNYALEPDVECGVLCPTQLTLAGVTDPKVINE
jgi:3'-phosphoadenosine 5'-phosphosulfate sulfotransferase (PAPS reductase)/FAD synthetase